jgi:diadenylate cyclase
VAATPGDRAQATATTLAQLADLSTDELLDADTVAGVLGLGGAEGLDRPVSPRGYRLLAKVPRLPATAADSLIRQFGGLQKLLAASVADLQRVEGVELAQARGVREGLSRLAESSLLERYS